MVREGQRAHRNITTITDNPIRYSISKLQSSRQSDNIKSLQDDRHAKHKIVYSLLRKSGKLREDQILLGDDRE